MQYIRRLIRLLFGLLLFSLGIAFTIQGNVGLAPWEVFHSGLSRITGISFGTIVTLAGIVILLVAIFLKERIGIGTVLNTLLIGPMVDMIQSVKVIPPADNFIFGVILLLIGQFIISLGSYFYIGSAFCSGPRDSLMIGLSKVFKNIPIGVIRGSIEGLVLIIGWLLGGKVGLGTIIAVLGIGFILQWTFKILHFNVSEVKHESLLDSWKLIAASRKKEKNL